MPSQRDLPLEDVLSEVLMLDHEPNSARLANLCAAHPDHKEEIIAFFEAWREQIALGGGVGTQDIETDFSEDLAKRGVAQALALLVNGAQNARALTGRPHRLRLSAIVRSFGVDEARFARACGLDEMIVGKLDRRCIQPTSDIPLRCFERMSETLVQGARADRAVSKFHLALAHALQAAVSGAPLAPNKELRLFFLEPRRDTQSFRQAIEASSLSEEEKRIWLKAPAGDVA